MNPYQLAEDIRLLFSGGVSLSYEEFNHITPEYSIGYSGVTDYVSHGHSIVIRMCVSPAKALLWSERDKDILTSLLEDSGVVSAMNTEFSGHVTYKFNIYDADKLLSNLNELGYRKYETQFIKDLEETIKPD